jgi:hypothetical protein
VVICPAGGSTVTVEHEAGSVREAGARESHQPCKHSQCEDWPGEHTGYDTRPLLGSSMGRPPITPHPPPRLRNECVGYTYTPVETAEGRTAHSNGWNGVNRMSRKPHV